jgi:archaemetzincin
LGLVEINRLSGLATRVVAAHIQTIFELEIDFLDPTGVPEEAFQCHRRQYDAGIILRHLASFSFPSNLLRILALTTVDLCTPILTYVYGEAELGGRIAIVSNFRLHQNENGSQASLDDYYQRLAKVALHEIAHTFSLYHCEAPGCLMRFSPKIQHLDELEICFCERCEFILRQALKH